MKNIKKNSCPSLDPEINGEIQKLLNEFSNKDSKQIDEKNKE